jgi:hypothetical protein
MIWVSVQLTIASELGFQVLPVFTSTVFCALPKLDPVTVRFAPAPALPGMELIEGAATTEKLAILLEFAPFTICRVAVPKPTADGMLKHT